MGKHAMPRNGWRRTAGGAIIGTVVAGGLLLTSSTPLLARSVPTGAIARAAQPGGTGGYWLVKSNGAVYNFGTAANYGSMANKHLNAPIVNIVAAPNGKGYWLVGSDGGVFAFGSAHFYK
jgi:hypothetical protein